MCETRIVLDPLALLVRTSRTFCVLGFSIKCVFYSTFQSVYSYCHSIKN